MIRTNVRLIHVESAQSTLFPRGSLHCRRASRRFGVMNRAHPSPVIFSLFVLDSPQTYDMALKSGLSSSLWISKVQTMGWSARVAGSKVKQRISSWAEI